MRKNRRRLLWLSIFILLLSGTTGIMLMNYLPATPPTKSIQLCQETISKARHAEADIYAKLLLSEAEHAWQEAWLEWKIQNSKWIISRNYTRLTGLVLLATRKGQDAYEKSISVKDSLHHDLACFMDQVEEKLKNYEKNYYSLPLNRQSRVDYNAARMLFWESREAYERGNYNRVIPKLEKSSSLINASILNAHQSLEEYFDQVTNWKKWADETIAWTKANQSTAIIVDKFAQKCYVYRSGKITSSFDAEFGPNWIGNKKHRGDQATPEGKYRITKKKTKRETKYYKALLINYPNQDDQVRFANEVKNGRIAKRTGIGNLIEIHGEGGKGINWTNGCVALKNEDMDKIFSLVKVDTPVTIIGSMRSLAEVNGF